MDWLLERSELRGVLEGPATGVERDRDSGGPARRDEEMLSLSLRWSGNWKPWTMFALFRLRYARALAAAQRSSA
jgi:hypothetical protein